MKKTNLEKKILPALLHPIIFLIIFLIILATFLTPHQSSAANVYRSFQPGRFDTYLEAKYFKTESNFGVNGNKENLDKQNLQLNFGLQEINTQTAVRYVLSNNLGIYSGLNFGNVESSKSDNVTNTTTIRENSLLTYILLGTDYQVMQSNSWSLYTDATYLHSNELIDIYSDDALASDGASQFKLQFVGVLKTESLRSFARIGYNYRAEELSSLLLYGLGAEYLFANSALGAEIEGFSSVKDDLQTSTPLFRDTLTNRVNAGSKRYFSINPNLMEARLYYAYAFDPNFVVKLSGGASVIGSNSADGYFADLSVNWGFGGAGDFAHLSKQSNTQRNKQPKKVINNSSLPDSEPGFQIETDDGVNQDLFKSTEPVKLKD